MLTRKLLWAGLAYGIYRLFRGSKHGVGMESGAMSTDTTRQHI